MAVRQVMLNESSDIMWDTGPRNENGQGEIDKLGEKNNSTRGIYFKNQ